VTFDWEGIKSLIRARNRLDEEDEYSTSRWEITKPSRVIIFLFI
jgi:hypothetical protein